jgi:septal ring factor EnvC (AmiA/AmiB activator)
MLTFFRTHWLVITICLVYTLLATGAAYYFASSAAHENKAAQLKMTEELKAAKETQEKSSTEAVKAKAALDKEKALNTNLKKMLTAAEQERESLRASLETMTLAATKTAKPQPRAAKATPAPASTACRDKNAAAEKDLKNQQNALQAFKADVYKRDNELRERQKQLDETLAKIAEERRKIERDRADYRWPHNGSQTTK